VAFWDFIRRRIGSAPLSAGAAGFECCLEKFLSPSAGWRGFRANTLNGERGRRGGYPRGGSRWLAIGSHQE
jgi:hypothetical protein